MTDDLIIFWPQTGYLIIQAWTLKLTIVGFIIYSSRNVESGCHISQTALREVI